MKKEYALRYLLLRHILEAGRHLPENVLREACSTLHVDLGKEGYKIRWAKEGQTAETVVSEEKFEFYRRGDIDSISCSLSDSLADRNNSHARDVAERILNLKQCLIRTKREAINIRRRVSIVLDIVFLCAVAVLGELNWTGWLLFVLFILLEWFRKGRLYTAVCLCVLAFSSLSAGVFFASIVYAVLQYLDSNNEYRIARSILSVCAAVISFFVAGILLKQFNGFNTIFWAVFLSAFIISGCRIFFSTHARAVPLALPFFCAGLAIAGFQKTALAGIIYSIAQLYIDIYGYKLWNIRIKRN